MKKLKTLRKGFAVLLIATLAIASTSTSCKRCTDPCDPECKNYDPCCGQAPANAQFTIYEILQRNPSMRYQGYEPKDVATDTIIFINVARFYADYEADYYEWRLDGDNRVWNTREFFLGFINLPYYTPAEVTLKVYKPFDRSCFPNGQDTAIYKRTLYTVPFDSSKVYGTYNGYLKSQPNISRPFEIFNFKDMFGGKEDSIRGIFPYCSQGTNSALKSAMGYKSWFFTTKGTSLGCCYGLSGFAELKGADELEMTVGYYNATDSCEYTVLNNAPYITDEFYGIKSN